MKYFEHENIIKLVYRGKVQESSSNYKSFLMTKYHKHGDLLRLLLSESHKSEQISVYSIIRVLKQIYSGLSYLWSLGRVHGDLTLDNIVVDSAISEIGVDLEYILSNATFLIIDLETVNTSGNRWKLYTEPYSDPEVLENNRICVYNEIYSFGMIIRILSSRAISHKLLHIIDKIGFKCLNHKYSLKTLT